MKSEINYYLFVMGIFVLIGALYGYYLELCAKDKKRTETINRLADYVGIKRMDSESNESLNKRAIMKLRGREGEFKE
ncbi:hypothetical protein KAR91_04000 [Candidatus Pacearchaeota archaeon]|nr:hypothetical protein [Candidatus Pacearchaeota archaeon]